MLKLKLLPSKVGAAAMVFLACCAFQGCERVPSQPELKADPTAGPVAGRLEIGSISRDPSDEYHRFRPLLDLMAHPPGDRPGWAVHLHVVETVPEMARALAEGSVDLYMDSAFPVLKACRLSGARPALLWKKHGVETHASVLFARRGAGPSSLGALRDHSLVLSATTSTSGYLLPVAFLRDRGMVVADPEEMGTPGSVRVLLSGDAENTVFWVLEGRGDAGAVSNEYFDRLAGIRAGELAILATTPAVPRALVCLRADLGAGRQRDIVSFLSSLGETPDGRRRLGEFQRTGGFGPIPGAELATAMHLLDVLDRGTP